jgi:hypothetical protein
VNRTPIRKTENETQNNREIVKDYFASAGAPLKGFTKVYGAIGLILLRRFFQDLSQLSKTSLTPGRGRRYDLFAVGVMRVEHAFSLPWEKDILILGL